MTEQVYQNFELDDPLGILAEQGKGRFLDMATWSGSEPRRQPDKPLSRHGWAGPTMSAWMMLCFFHAADLNSRGTSRTIQRNLH